MAKKADKIGGDDYSVRPVEVDRKALSELIGKRKVGDAIDGLGGFVLESYPMVPVCPKI